MEYSLTCALSTWSTRGGWILQTSAHEVLVCKIHPLHVLHVDKAQVRLYSINHSRPQAPCPFPAVLKGNVSRRMSHSHEHRPQTFFWRRVFDQKFAQATSNTPTFSLRSGRREDLLAECKIEIRERTTAMEARPSVVAARAAAKGAAGAAMTAAPVVGATAPTSAHARVIYFLVPVWSIFVGCTLYGKLPGTLIYFGSRTEWYTAGNTITP